MADPASKREYQNARSRALRDLGRNHRDEYEALMPALSGNSRARGDKNAYNRARIRALQTIGERYRDEYEELMSRYLGRNLNPLRQKAVRSRWGKDG